VSPPGDYRHRYSAWLSPRVLPWIVVAALVLVFVLTFFSWVGFYPGGIHVISQTGWQAALGSFSVDPDLEKEMPGRKDGKDRFQPGASLLLILFLLLVIFGLLVAAVAAAMGMASLRMPPWLEQLRPWRWTITSGVLLLAFLLLCFQLLSGFGLPSKMREEAEKEHAAQVKLLVEQNAPNRATATKALEIAQGTIISFLSRTTALCLVFWLTLLALVCAAATFWLGRRTNLPLPRIDVMW
jgi:amino acid transporter